MIEILLNDVTLDGMRRVRVASDLDASSLPAFVPLSAKVRTWSDDALGLHYLEATWPCRELIMVKCEAWKCSYPLVVWKLAPGERVSEAFQAAFRIWAEKYKACPDFAFMRRLPKTIENGFEMYGSFFFEADWVPPGCIAVGNGG